MLRRILKKLIPSARIRARLLMPIGLAGRFFYGLVTLLEGPFFLLANRAIFDNSIVFVYWLPSFGHTILAMDHASRLYYPHPISLIYLPHRKSNTYVVQCFQHNIQPYVCQSKLLPQAAMFDSARYEVMRFLVLLISAFSRRFQVIEHRNIYKTGSLAACPLYVGKEQIGQLLTTGDTTGYVRLLRAGAGKTPRLPIELRQQCFAALERAHPGFHERPFVTILLRRKGEGGEFDDAFRVAGPHAHYVAAVQHITDRGFHVAGTGETEHRHFKDIRGYYSLDAVRVDPNLLNIYLLSECRMFIGQQSGPHVLPNARGILCLICDAMPHRLGTFKEEDLILFKHLRLRPTGKRLSLVEIFKDYPALAYGYQFARHQVDIEPNSEEEILEATREALTIVAGEQQLTDYDRLLIERFRQLPAEGMTLRYQRNRPPMFVLRGLANELLENYGGREQTASVQR